MEKSGKETGRTFREGGKLFSKAELEELKRVDREIDEEFERTYSPRENSGLDAFLDEFALWQRSTQKEYAARLAGLRAKRAYYLRNRERFRRYYRACRRAKKAAGGELEKDEEV